MRQESGRAMGGSPPLAWRVTTAGPPGCAGSASMTVRHEAAVLAAAINEWL
ncbi:hypothetical protein ACFPK5_08695 [Streptomyces beijiangensis]|uniref:hypothetical protein n=1 Tax=Streptomyces beijiangensis TaxID=163361 RepID=UPI0036208279